MEKMTLKEAVDIKGVVLKRRNVGECPVCERMSAKYNFQKDIFSCPACGEYGGGVLDFWAYWSGITGANKAEIHKQAAKSIQEYYGNTSSNVIKERKKKAAEAVKTCENEAKLAPIKVRNLTYRRLLESLELSEQHKRDLLGRGLSSEDIVRCQFRSMPNTSKERMCADMIRDGYVLEGVPGFWKKDGKWVFGNKYQRGILIPQKDSLGRIQGFQIRNDEKEHICKHCKFFTDSKCTNGKCACYNKFMKKNDSCSEYEPDIPKYMSLSSADKPFGTSSGSFVHFAVHSYKRKIDYLETKVLLTEGPLKADIANALSRFDSPILAIPGVNSISYLEIALKELKKRGLTKIWIAFDMDYETNPSVRKALVNLESMLDKLGIAHKQYRWDLDEQGRWRGQFKGIDDWMVSLKK